MLAFFRKYKRVELALAIALVLSIFASVSSFAVQSAGVRAQVVRLHVLANSDSEEDQALKLLVRDAVLQAGSDLFDGSRDAQESLARLRTNRAQLQAAAQQAVVANGYDYPVEILIGKTYFSTRTYEGVTLPAGEYDAVQVVIGNGAGQNWWCVMFPPLCVSAAQEEDAVDLYFDKEGGELVQSNPQYEPRFKILELLERWRAA